MQTRICHLQERRSERLREREFRDWVQVRWNAEVLSLKPKPGSTVSVDYSVQPTRLGQYPDSLGVETLPPGACTGRESWHSAEIVFSSPRRRIGSPAAEYPNTHDIESPEASHLCF